MTEAEQQKAVELLRRFIDHAQDFGQYSEAEGETIREAEALLKELEP